MTTLFVFDKKYFFSSLLGIFLSFQIAAQYCMPLVQDAGYGIGITRVRLTTTSPALSIDNSSFIASGIGVGVGVRNVEDYTSSDSATLEINGVYRLIINSGLSNASDAIQVVAWIDFNQNSVFDPSEEIVYMPYLPVNAATTTLPFVVPSGAVLGRTKMRIVAEPYVYPKPTACADKDYGEVEDYTINIVNPYVASSFVSCEAFQQNVTNASRGATNEILGVKIVVNGLLPSLNAEEFTFNTNGSTSIPDITNAKLWYTGIRKSFSNAQLLGTPYLNPNGSFTMLINQPLFPDSNYFWLTYDIADTARTCQIIDAECTDVKINAVNHIPAITAPAGNRNITSNQLVPNPDFEEKLFCPSGIVSPGTSFPAARWYCPTVQGTTDYYHACSNISNGGNGSQGLPTNSGGTQQAINGEGYIGMQTNVIEYLAARLTQPLIKGRAYCASMYINLADGSALANDGMGIAFTVDSIKPRSISYLPYTPKVQNPQGSFLTSKTNWVKISGSFIADSAYEFILIGNFRHSGTYNTVTVPGGVVPTYSYYYVDAISLIENPIVNITGDTLICSGDSTYFTAHAELSIGKKDLLYSWEEISNPGVVIGADSILGVTSVSNKTFVVTVSNCGDSCVGGGKDTIALTVMQRPNAAITPPGSICISDSAYQLSAATAGGIWNGAAITDSSLGIFNATQAGPGTHQVIYSMPGLCTSADSINITVIPRYNASITPVGPFCKNENASMSVQLTAYDTGGVWSGNGIINSSIGIFSPSVGTGTHQVVYTIPGNCGDADSINIVVYPAPVADAGTDVTVTSGVSVILNGSGGVSYQWTPSSMLDCDTCINPVASPAQTTTYYVLVTDVNGCTNIDSVTITIIEVKTECGCVFIPNAFSPNGDGQNDVLKIQGTDVLEYFYLQVYDRWGEKVYETQDNLTGWDGTFNGKEKDSDTFIFKFEAKCPNGEFISKTGNIYLLK